MSRSAGQSTVEFALVSLIFITIVLGIFDFSYLFSGRLVAYAAARNAARYAASHPTSWSNASSPPPASIEGHLVLPAVPARVVNDDAHLVIGYYLLGTGAPTLCGTYSATANAFVPTGTYTQAGCLQPGTLIQVRAVYVYTFITPFLKASWSSLTITTTATALEET